MSQLICFDFDGTVMNTWPSFEQVAIRYTRDNNLPDLCLDSLRIGYGYPDDHEFWAGMSKHDQHRHLHNMYRLADDPYHPMMEGIIPDPFDGVAGTLERLKGAGYTLAIVTAKPRQPLDALLTHHKIDHYFCGFRTCDDIAIRGEKCKPYPDQLLSIIRELDYTPDRAVMVGDTCMDIKMARAANVRSIGVTWGNHPKDRLRDAGADHVLSCRFESVVDIVTGWS